MDQYSTFGLAIPIISCSHRDSQSHLIIIYQSTYHDTFLATQLYRKKLLNCFYLCLFSNVNLTHWRKCCHSVQFSSLIHATVNTINKVTNNVAPKCLYSVSKSSKLNKTFVGFCFVLTTFGLYNWCCIENSFWQLSKHRASQCRDWELRLWLGTCYWQWLCTIDNASS